MSGGYETDVRSGRADAEGGDSRLPTGDVTADRASPAGRAGRGELTGKVTRFATGRGPIRSGPSLSKDSEDGGLGHISSFPGVSKNQSGPELHAAGAGPINFDGVDASEGETGEAVGADGVVFGLEGQTREATGNPSIVPARSRIEKRDSVNGLESNRDDRPQGDVGQNLTSVSIREATDQRLVRDVLERPEESVTCLGTGEISRDGDNLGEVTNRTIYDLREIEARNQLSTAFLESEGKAVVIVHPLFPMWDGGGELIHPFEEAQYLTYIQRLREIHGESPSVPVILFEDEPESEFQNLTDTLTQIGIPSGNVYVILTKRSDTEPLQGSLGEFIETLQALGLTEATIHGSYFNHDNLPTGGCVNHILITMQNSGVKAVVGNATF